jgi:chemotaxis protein methyltransferase CheR
MSIVNTPMTSQRLDGDLSFTSADFTGISRLLHTLTGIKMNDSNEAMVFSRLGKRVRELGFSSFSSYVSLVSDPTSLEERDYLISALTTNTTHFFRESYHFDILTETILPDLIRRAREGERIRLWSAACSSGEEAYSIALCVLAAFPDVHNFDFKILATDIDQIILKRAYQGCYLRETLKEIPKEYLELGFESGPDSACLYVNKRMQSMISFRQLNLIERWPFTGKFDVIFCRNVAIYMDLQTQEMIWRAFSDVIRPGGHLFIGHSERLPTSMKARFELIGKTAYRVALGSFDKFGE